MFEKAEAADFAGRFREVISDPLNLLIRRVPEAGCVDSGNVYLHNGLKVPLEGEGAYYGDFSRILVLNRGVHEPLEEFVFQQVVDVLPEAPVMLELGAYWGHYSMWLKRARPRSAVVLVEPDAANMRVGQANFALNGLEGTFIQDFVACGRFGVDAIVESRGLDRVDVLHADIQGYELEMLDGCSAALAAGKVSYAFVSTHSQSLHDAVIAKLAHAGYRVEASADFDTGTTSYDGFVFGVAPQVAAVLRDFVPLSRVALQNSAPADLLDYLQRARRSAAVAG